MYQVWIIWGDTAKENGEDAISNYAFHTKKELTAFMEGVDAACGWMDYFQAPTEQEANVFVNEQ